MKTTLLLVLVMSLCCYAVDFEAQEFHDDGENAIETRDIDEDIEDEDEGFTREGRNLYLPDKGPCNGDCNCEDGAPGQKGQKGQRGCTGQKGLKGQRGPKGFRGRKGKDGKDGKDGHKGDTGDKGPKGCTGLKGCQGNKGEPGYPCNCDVKKVAFAAKRTADPYCGAEAIITFNEVSVNIGDAFDPDTGIFTARCDGYYFFTFNARKPITETSIQVDLKLNGATKLSINELDDHRQHGDTGSISCILDLDTNDQVYLELVVGESVEVGPFKPLAFTGFILYENPGGHGY
ncbi:uncharacterized protein LOC144433092 [Glandiceps talaboti]